ncbi:hypothetical protein OESDEN_13424 [Oesophagostomum dentatum]|uniref:Uncharacterized protein n=1 Tax=Oesophagostomum dentatum TaxID=61180 RepID=A0A0B1SPC9_OESDE|nr:hypothetical protein OESDEN_13424 [Oesophagostomum dentatum]
MDIPVAASRVSSAAPYSNPVPVENSNQSFGQLHMQPVAAPVVPTPHITTIPISPSAIKEKSSSPMEEKFCPFSDAPQEPPCVRSSSRIPKYVLTSLDKDHANEQELKVSPTTAASPSPLKSSNAVDPATDLENVSPASLTISPSNPKAKPNTGIPKPSKLRPPTARHKPAETNIQQEEPRISRIPKISDGAGFRAANNGLSSFSGPTRIPIKTGYDRTSQSRLITDL